MSALAGFLSFGGDFPAAEACRLMLAAQSQFGPHDQSLADRGRYAAGRCLYRLLPEDRFDRQPLSSADGRFLLIADARIDNREELVGELGVAPSEGRALCDAEVLLHAYVRWGEGMLSRLAGSFAFAIWDAVDQAITLAKDATGERPLFYVLNEGYFAFSTMVHGFRALPDAELAADSEMVAQFLADIPVRGSRSFIKGVHRVQPGSLLRMRGQSTSGRRYWDPKPPELRLPNREAYAEALREQLDRATSARLRRAGGRVGSHLSAGFDSSAVTATAARLLRDSHERLFAFTSAPREGFDGPVLAGRIADESAIAAATVALHSNIDHIVIRPSGASPLSALKKSQALLGRPVGHVCNNLWWSGINKAAQARGVSVMLTGELGNLTLSAGGGLEQLTDLVRTQRWPSWWREARALAAGEHLRWRALLDASIGPWLPENLYVRLGRLLAKSRRDPGDSSFLRRSWQKEMTRQAEFGGWQERPPRDSRRRRVELIELADSGVFRKLSLAQWGVDERDPTADRRLIEFSLSLPVEAYLDQGERRPVLRAALADRLPAAVLDHRLRGHQAADWYEYLPHTEVQQFAREMRNGKAADVVDFDVIDEAIAAWPASGWEQRAIIGRYQMQLLRTLAAAQFMNSACDGDRDA